MEELGIIQYAYVICPRRTVGLTLVINEYRGGGMNFLSAYRGLLCDALRANFQDDYFNYMLL